MQALKNTTGYGEYLKTSQNDLALQYLPAVKSMAFRLKERLPSSVDLNDLISIGTEELIKIAKKYDSSINDSFWGYARTRVNGAMLDYLRSLDVLSRSSRKLVKDIESVVSKYYNEHEDEPTNSYIANVLDKTIDKIKEARIASDIYALIPLDEHFHADESDDISADLERKQLMEMIHKVLETMPKRDQLIIQLYYLEELKLSEISEILKITESRISQKIKEVTKKIKDELGDING